MRFTLAKLAELLQIAVERGHGELVVDANLPLDIRTLTGCDIPYAEVKRNETGRWWHPLFPERCDVPPIRMRRWLHQRGYDFTVTLLIAPDDAQDTFNISSWSYTRPNGDGWICWEINTNTDGIPVAIWIAPMNRLETL